MFKDLRLRPSSQMGASTGIDALTGDPAAVRRCQKRDYVRDIPRLTPSSEDRITGSELERGRILKHGGFMSVATNPGWIALIVIPREPSWLDREGSAH